MLDVSSDALDTPEWTERGKLEQELKRWEKLLQTDSGENHINIHKGIADTKAKLAALDAVEKAEKELNEDSAENLANQSEMQDAQEESATDFVVGNDQERVDEPKEEVSLDEAKDILKGLF